MNEQDLMAQFLRDYSLLLRTYYYSRITDFLLTNIEPFYWEDSYEFCAITACYCGPTTTAA